MNVLIVSSNYEYDEMFEENGFTLVDDIEEADLLCFTGGEDVSPHLYGEKPHVTTYSNVRRDNEEGAIFRLAEQLGKPMVGVCRGGQFLNVMSGGALWQNVDNHAIGGTHPVFDIKTATNIDCTSTHHQMMRPSQAGKLLGVAYLSGFKQRVVDGVVETVKSDEGTQDAEVVYYSDTSALCFQPHPEYFRKGADCQVYFFKLIKEYLKVEV